MELNENQKLYFRGLKYNQDSQAYFRRECDKSGVSLENFYSDIVSLAQMIDNEIDRLHIENLDRYYAEYTEEQRREHGVFEKPDRSNCEITINTGEGSQRITFLDVREMRKIVSKNLGHEVVDVSTEEAYEIILDSQKEQLRLLYDLGILDYLIEKYPNTLKGSNNQVAKLIASALRLQSVSIQPSINALLTDNASSKNYPKKTAKTESIITELNHNELK